MKRGVCPQEEFCLTAEEDAIKRGLCYPWKTEINVHRYNNISFRCNRHLIPKRILFTLEDRDRLEVHLKTNSVTLRKLSVSVIKASQLMLYREIIAVCSQIHAKHINKPCRQNVELLNVKLAVHIVTTGLYKVERCGKVS